jgi:hypothetical protein
MELHNAERRLQPSVRLASAVAAHLAREELSDAEARLFDSAQRSKALSEEAPVPGSPGSGGGGGRRVRKRGRRVSGSPSAVSDASLLESGSELPLSSAVPFLTRAEKAARAGRDRERTLECYRLIMGEQQRGSSRAPLRRLDLRPVLALLTDQVLWELGELCPACDEIVLEGWSSVSLSGLRSLALGFGERLVRLDLGRTPLTDEMVSMLAARFFCLEDLLLVDCTLVGNSAGRSLGESASGTLRSLDLTRCALVSDDALMWLSGQIGPASVPCARLRSLSLQECPRVRDRGLLGLGRGCHGLRFVNLSRCAQVTDAGVEGLLAGCRRLEVLNLGGCTLVGDASLRAAGARCAELRSLSLQLCSRVSDRGLEALAACRHLQALNLAGCAQVSELGVFFVVSHNKALGTLNVTGCDQVSQRGLQEMLRGLPFVELAQSFAGFKPRERVAELKLDAQEQLVRDEASRRIAAALRGHGTRLALRRARLAARRAAAATRLQSWFRAQAGRRAAHVARESAWRERAGARLARWWRARLAFAAAHAARTVRAQNARNGPRATKLQALYRGHATRRRTTDVAAALARIWETRWAEALAAVTVRAQAIVRQRLSAGRNAARREELAQRSADMRAAAVTVQRLVRGFLGVLCVARRRQWFRRHFALQLNAATQIQRTVRGMIGKRKARDQRREREEQRERMRRAALVLQRLRRGMLGRAAMHRRRLEHARQTAAAVRVQATWRRFMVLPWRQARLEQAKRAVAASSDVLHARAAENRRKRIELRDLGLGRDSASEDESIRALGGQVGEDETDDWQEHWDPVLEHSFFFSPSRNQRSFAPYVGDSFQRAVIGKYVKVMDPDSRKWRLGAVQKFNSNKGKHRVEYREAGGNGKDHEWLVLGECESRIQVFDDENEAWGMLRNMRIAFQKQQRASRDASDERSAAIASSLASSSSSSSSYVAQRGTATSSTASASRAAATSDSYATQSVASFPGQLSYAPEYLDVAGIVERHLDLASGCYYLYNTATGETSWEQPS